MSFDRPWFKFYESTPCTLHYPDISMYDMAALAKEKTPEATAYTFFGRSVTYKAFLSEVDRCARALFAYGIRPGDKITVCLPNMPQAVVMFYAINRIGAVANMVHPLSAENEILFYLKESNSRLALIMADFYDKFEGAFSKSSLEKVIVASVAEALPPVKSVAYRVAAREKKVTADEAVSWREFLSFGKAYDGALPKTGRGEDVAAVLYSGGTTGACKGILLTNLNFNAMAMQTAAFGGLSEGESMLSIIPMFHGFGLGVCIHTMLSHGGSCILVPRLNMKEFPKLFKKYRPNYMAGVPTLFEAMLRAKGMDKMDLSCMKGVFSGGDSLPLELKKKMDAFLHEHHATIQVREGYGMTECVSASCLTPKNYSREGSIGIPFPDMFYKIVTPETNDEVATGQIGEICIFGPTVMKEYLNNPRETLKTLRIHEDGKRWLHTGDLGYVDEEGFVYFVQRLKRMIITSGYNVYPSQIENVIDAHEAVLASTVIGVKDAYRMQRIKAYIVLKPGVEPTDEVKASIRAHCEKNIARYALPRDYEYRDELPKTLVGKVAYTVLEKEEAEKTQPTT